MSAAGDVNGDGLADLIVGANKSDPAAGANAGRSYVIFGTTDGSFGPTAVNWLGTDGADTHSDGGTAQTLVAGAGNDTLTATAASVLYGGAGLDTFNINAAMVTALENPMGSFGNLERLARIDGGSGKDTLKLSGALITLDLSLIANQAGGNPTGGSRLSSIEIIKLDGGTMAMPRNILKLKASDVFDLSEANVFENTGRHQLMVKGSEGQLMMGTRMSQDTVNFADGDWGKVSGTLQFDGLVFDVWNNLHSVNTVYVQQNLAVLGVAI
jgi:hypothetical protein